MHVCAYDQIRKCCGLFYEHCFPLNNLLGHWEIFLHYPVTQTKQLEVAQINRKYILLHDKNILNEEVFKNCILGVFKLFQTRCWAAKWWILPKGNIPFGEGLLPTWVPFYFILFYRSTTVLQIEKLLHSKLLAAFLASCPPGRVCTMHYAEVPL